MQFEDLLSDVVSQGGELLRSQDRMRQVISINQDLVSRRDLDEVLSRIAELGCQVVGSRFAAIAVLGFNGALDQIITSGMSDAQVAAISEVPEDQGLLSALTDGLRSIRAENLGADGSASGPLPHHAPTDAVLGVPITVGEEVFGNLYLMESLDGRFSADDEEMARALAAAAGVAIENARLFERAKHRELISDVLLELSQTEMRATQPYDVNLVITRLNDLVEVDAIVAAIADLDANTVTVEAAVGSQVKAFEGLTFDLTETFSRHVLRSNEPMLIPDVGVSEHPVMPEQANFEQAAFFPFVVADQPAGFLALLRGRGCGPIGERDFRTAQDFALHLAVVHERHQARESRERLAVLEDRERIARDLHDHVIQRLFATVMNLQVEASRVAPDTADTLTRQIAEIDGAIMQIRQSIFAIKSSVTKSDTSVRSRVFEMIERIASTDRALDITSTFSGPVDLLVDGELADDVVAVATEAASNAVRHSGGSRLTLDVSVSQGTVCVTASDDGKGVPDDAQWRGMANMAARARRRDGRLDVSPRPGGGTVLTWTASTL